MVVVNKFNLILYLLSIFTMINGCTSNTTTTQMVSSNEFKKEYENSKVQHTMKSYKLLNTKNGRICLEKEEMSYFNKNKWNKKIICTQIDLLDKDMKNEILNLLEKKPEV